MSVDVGDHVRVVSQPEAPTGYAGARGIVDRLEAGHVWIRFGIDRTIAFAPSEVVLVAVPTARVGVNFPGARKHR